MNLANRTLFITGCTRGIGKAIAMRAAADGANIAVLGKTDEPHPKLEGTVYSACEEIREAGGQAIPCVADVRNESEVAKAIEQTIGAFGGIDILVNNASAIQLASTDAVSMGRFDLMHQVNTRATFLCSKLCLPALRLAPNPHILTMSPPLQMRAEWFGPHLAYSLSKFGMSLCTLGLAHELRADAVAVNSLWPKTLIGTAAVRNLLGGEDMVRASRRPEIVADAAHSILSRPSRECTGNFFIDEDVLKGIGITTFDVYAQVPGAALQSDLFVDPDV